MLVKLMKYLNCKLILEQLLLLSPRIESSPQLISTVSYLYIR